MENKQTGKLYPVLMLAHRLRLWPNIKPALGQRLQITGMCQFSAH